MESCQNGKHLGQLLFGYCSNIQCISNLKTFCDICKYHHDEHYQDLQQLDSLDNIKLKNNEQMNQMGNFIENQQKFYLEFLATFKEMDLRNLKIDYQNNNDLIDQLKQIVKIESVLNTALPICQNVQQSCTLIMQELNKLKKNKEQEIQEKPKQGKKQKLIQKQGMKQKQLSQKQVISEIKQWQDFKLHFSQKFKYKWIKILNNGQMAKNEDDRGMVICEPMLPKKGQYRFAFGINENSYLIWIGICHKEFLMQNDFKTYFDEKPICNNGVYLVNNYGVAYSHLPTDNTESFIFSPDDLIIVYVDMDKGNITWKSKVSNNKYSMKFDATQDVHACAGITSFSPVFLVEKF
ncbi:unnamed protein product (macronuclear) [Paramecium tetraurelia]|uniref:B30.2/SPRY domain-containing protein n=1 Tax=Paramecium tetraurelia TaxID=5888 RepID=A0DUI3_PARTE|nr:uncharacterized protein GSPATT00020372001 [Paramecium tetraurelia]CAK86700.1 unnamed protein product [Paramecium tetraurelia]|eukprot:XP_001454097.1 hypothetical protein (macronuclear) [Paramecium tetraurelia strain d4-2]